jgi:hypothetical protein
MYMSTNGLNVYPTAQGTYPKNLGTQNDIWTNVYAENVSGGSNGLILFAPSNTSVSLEMEDGTIDFKDRDKNTTAWFDLGGLSNNTSYSYKFPTKPGTLATTQPLNTYSETLSGISGASQVAISSIGGGGYYHLYLETTDGIGNTTYSDIGTARIITRSKAPSGGGSFQYIGSAITGRGAGGTGTVYKFWLQWTSTTTFNIKGATTDSIRGDGSDNNTFTGTIYFYKLFDLE